MGLKMWNECVSMCERELLVTWGHQINFFLVKLGFRWCALYDVFSNFQVAKKEKDTSGLRLNGQIQAPFVRLVTEEGISVGNAL